MCSESACVVLVWEKDDALPNLFSKMAKILLPLIVLVSAMLLLEIFSPYQHSGKSFGKGCNPPNRLISIVGASPTKHEKSLHSRAKKTIRVKCPDFTKLGITPTPSLTGGQVPNLQSGKKSLTSKPKGWLLNPIITSTTIEKQFTLRFNGTVRYMTQQHQSINYYQPHEADKTPTGNNPNQKTTNENTVNYRQLYLYHRKQQCLHHSKYSHNYCNENQPTEQGWIS